MIAGGLDTTPACILLGIAILSGPQGASLQTTLLENIESSYPDGNAWEKCLQDEKCGYVMAFCKEVLRFWTVIPMSLPRVSIKDVEWEGATIPAGTTFLMVRSDQMLLVLCGRTNDCVIRTPGQQTSTPSISNHHETSARSDSSTCRMDRAHSTSLLGPVPACVRARTSHTERCTSRSCACCSLLRSCLQWIRQRGRS